MILERLELNINDWKIECKMLRFAGFSGQQSGFWSEFPYMPVCRVRDGWPYRNSPTLRHFPSPRRLLRQLEEGMGDKMDRVDTPARQQPFPTGYWTLFYIGEKGEIGKG